MKRRHIFTIHKRPRDYPYARYLLREWHIDEDGYKSIGDDLVVGSIQEARSRIPTGCMRLHTVDDDPKVVETWIMIKEPEIVKEPEDKPVVRTIPEIALRDYLAGQALNSIISDSIKYLAGVNNFNAEEDIKIATAAYRIADAMMDVRCGVRPLDHAYRQGYSDATRNYAVNKDGRQLVGTMLTPLQEVLNEIAVAPIPIRY